MLNELLNPIKTIEKEKKTKTIKNQALTLAISSIMFSIALILIIIKINQPLNLAIIAIIATITYFVSAFIGAFIYNLLVNIIANKGKYKDSFVAVVQTALIISAGLLAVSLLIQVPQIGFILGLIAMFFTVIIALSVFIRAMTTLTGANTTQILAILIIMVVGLIIATQIIISIQILSQPLPNMPVEEFAINLSDMPAMN
jgi:hypothetical protein